MPPWSYNNQGGELENSPPCWANIRICAISALPYDIDTICQWNKASDWRDRGLNGQQLNGLRPNNVHLVLLYRHGSPILALVQYRPYHNDIANSAPPPLGYWKSFHPRAILCHPLAANCCPRASSLRLYGPLAAICGPRAT